MAYGEVLWLDDDRNVIHRQVIDDAEGLSEYLGDMAADVEDGNSYPGVTGITFVKYEEN